MVKISDEGVFAMSLRKYAEYAPVLVQELTELAMEAMYDGWGRNIGGMSRKVWEQYLGDNARTIQYLIGSTPSERKKFLKCHDPSSASFLCLAAASAAARGCALLRAAQHLPDMVGLSYRQGLGEAFAADIQRAEDPLSQGWPLAWPYPFDA